MKKIKSASHQTKEAVFSIENFKISSFSFKEAIHEDGLLSIDFEPSGTYELRNGRFKLILSFKAFEDDENRPPNVIIEAQLQATFKFQESIQLAEIPSYFYKNAIAIVFPYLRAFISTLTLQANLRPMILPVLNLSNLEEQFKAHVKTI